MTYNVLVNMAFGRIISEATAQTQTGIELISKYQSYLMANPESCGVVNSFIKEANNCLYDKGINEAAVAVADYISQNKVSWALASACESIHANSSRYNMLNRNAASQAEKLLEQSEENVVKYIKAGALKNVMFCESFRSIAKQVFAGEQIVEHKADYTKITPVSLVENVGDGRCFVIAGKLYKADDVNNILEASWNEVSNTFKIVESLLESNMCNIDESKINIKFNNAEYTISEGEVITKKTDKETREFTVEQFRDHSRLVLMATNPRYKNQVAQVLEAVALTAENYDNIVNLDHAAIYATKNDKFVVIESGSTLFASLIASNRHPAWSINEDAIKVLSWIKAKTNVELGDEYKDAVTEAIAAADENQKEQIAEQLRLNEEKSLRERVELLTEKFKNDPIKLQVLAKLAADIASLND